MVPGIIRSCRYQQMHTAGYIVSITPIRMYALVYVDTDSIDTFTVTHAIIHALSCKLVSPNSSSVIQTRRPVIHLIYAVVVTVGTRTGTRHRNISCGALRMYDPCCIRLIDLNCPAFTQYWSTLPRCHRRRRGMALVAVYQLAPATICVISRSPSDRPRWWPLRPVWAVPFEQVHLSAPPRVLVKEWWSSTQSLMVAAAEAVGKLLRPVHPLGRSRISREYSQDGHLLMWHN